MEKEPKCKRCNKTHLEYTQWLPPVFNAGHYTYPRSYVKQALKICDKCGSCKNCCDCVTCYGCSKLFGRKEYCEQCMNCEKCCLCPKVKFVTCEIKFHKSNSKQKTINKSERFIAAEIEVKDLSNKKNEVNSIIKKWNGSVVEDGSLADTGFEINTSPANGDLFIKQVSEICAELNKNKAVTGKTCGLHIHVDARDFNYYDIARLMKLYIPLEPVFFKMVPAHRRDGHYSRICAEKYNKLLAEIGNKSATEIRKEVISYVYTGAERNNRRKKYSDARYDALNVHSWFYRGTIENRMFEGTTDAQQIINWGMLWARLLDYVMANDDEKISSVINKYKKNPESILTEIIFKNDEVIKSYIKQRLDKHKKVRQKKTRPIAINVPVIEVGRL